jgi:GNAT superfamily N-acetyltransferase
VIVQITYAEILPIWEEQLWVDRKDPIEPISCMTYLGGYQENQLVSPTFFAFMQDGKIVGVNSGHPCADGSYRSRGLWVNPSYRGRGIAKQLLFATIRQGEGSKFCWSFPRKDSWKTYESVGFQLTSEWAENVNNVNAYCVLPY